MTTPLDVLFGRNDWQRAALIVALVVVPGAVEQLDALHARPPATREGAASPPRSGRSRHVRPPRSC